MSVLEPILWTMLLLDSLIALACLLAAIESWWSFRNYSRSGSEMLAHAKQDLAKAKAICGKSGSSELVAGEWTKSVQQWSPALSKLLNVMVEPNFRREDQQENLWQLLQIRLEIICQRPHRLCGFVIKTATLLGLALTFVGVIEALRAFESSRHDLPGLIAGFYTALGSTILGIVAALAGILAIALNQTSQEQQFTVLEQLIRQLSAHTLGKFVSSNALKRGSRTTSGPKINSEYGEFDEAKSQQLPTSR